MVGGSLLVTEVVGREEVLDFVDDLVLNLVLDLVPDFVLGLVLDLVYDLMSDLVFDLVPVFGLLVLVLGLLFDFTVSLQWPKSD